MINTKVKEFFDKETWTLSYLVYDEKSKDAIVIDPVWDYDPAASGMSSESVGLIIDFIKANNLKAGLILETHAHADHVSGAQILRTHFKDAKVAIGKTITKVQEVFRDVYNLDKDFPTDGRQFDLLLEDGKSYNVGTLQFKVIATPGHTEACSSYLFDGMVFTGDALFMEDYGTGRCDFPKGSASDLYDSIQKLYSLPPETKVYTGHDYLPNDRPLKFVSTIGIQKATNVQLKATTSKEEFIEFRAKRDASLKAPRLLLPSIQININAGILPEVESNGVSYLKIPIRKEK